MSEGVAFAFSVGSARGLRLNPQRVSRSRIPGL